MVQSRTDANLEGRVIRPAGSDGVLLDDRHFHLEDITALTDELVSRSEGRLNELQEAARIVEARLRKQAEDGRAGIQRALEMARAQIDRQVEDTRQRAAELLETRHREGYEKGLSEGREKGEREGYEKGFSEGMAEGLEKGLLEGRTRGEEDLRRDETQRFREGGESARASLQELSTDLERAWGETIGSAREGLLDLSLTIAEGIVRERLDESPERVREMLEHALDRLEQQDQLVIEIHPEDRMWIDSLTGESLADRFGGNTPVRLIENEEVGRGGVRIQGNRGEVDATIAGQLLCARRRLEDAGGMP